MNNELYINQFVKLTNDELKTDKLCIKIKQDTIDDALKYLYKHIGLSYPKFYKMDTFSKAGFIAVEYLTQNIETNENTSLIFTNATSSIHTDTLYQAGIQVKENFVPSPSIFVYTLPNIVLGEICIRHKILGENIFLITDGFDAKFLIENIFLQFKLNKADNFIICWIEVSEKNLDVFTCFVSEKKTPNHILLDTETLLKLYNHGTNN